MQEAKTLPNDVARCLGAGFPVKLEEPCKTCRRFQQPSAQSGRVYFSLPPEFENGVCPEQLPIKTV